MEQTEIIEIVRLYILKNNFDDVVVDTFFNILDDIECGKKFFDIIENYNLA